MQSIKGLWQSDRRQSRRISPLWFFFVIFLFDLSFKKTVRLWSHLTSLMRTSECFQNGKLKNWRGVWKKGDFLLQQKWMSEGVRSVTSGEAASLKNATTVANVIVLWIKTPIITFNSQARGHVLFIPDEQRQTALQQLRSQLLFQRLLNVSCSLFRTF